MLYLLLVVLGVAGPLVLAWRFNLGTAETAATVVASLAPTYMGWEGLRIAWKSFRADADATLDTVADRLAAAVKAQWDEEMATPRRVNDPYPLPVAWRAADAELTESWPLLRDLAQAWPGGPPGDPAQWPSDAAGLAGQGSQIGTVFADRVPTRRLVILGEPGAGKSVLLIQLLQDLIERRSDGDPVPVLFSLASWNPHQPLKTWLADQLRRDYRGLRDPAPTPVTAPIHGPGDLARALLDAGSILPLLDGFDELPPDLHPAALDALNRALSAKQPLVLTSRAALYRAALTRPGTTVRLNGAAAIQLLPISPEQAAVYLRRDAGGPDTPAAARWDEVISRLGTDTAVGHTLSTPLGLFLARTIYNPRPQTAPEPAAPHPDELCDTTAFPDSARLNTHLFNAFIPAAYTPHSPRPPRWTPEQAHHALTFLARFLQTHRGGSPDLAWWELRQVLPMNAYLATWLAGGLAGGLLFGLAGGLMTRLMDGLGSGLEFGLAGGLMAGLAVAAIGTSGGIPAPSTRLRWSPRSHANDLVFVLVLILVLGLASGLAVGLGGEPALRLAAGLVAGLLTLFAFGIPLGLRPERPDLTINTAPAVLLSADRRNFIAFGLVVVLPVGLAAGLTFGLAFGLANGLTFGLAFGLANGIAVGLAFGLRNTAWPYFAITTAYLAVHRKVPRDLMAFLQDAHEHRGVLRQVGAVYQFRHVELQRHLAQ
ncbi:NACHT domain-containing protein [Streptomyces canus]|uniref:NACHT domain-containing protein n=1 Tax=Streptomyces canus TaxID=58343 RepID=UPI002E2FBF57|nr:NACHT domain-containing protein [Streptomyces canus]